MKSTETFKLGLKSLVFYREYVARAILVLAIGIVGVCAAVSVINGYKLSIEKLNYGIYSSALVLSENSFINDRYSAPTRDDFLAIQRSKIDYLEISAKRRGLAEVKLGDTSIITTLMGFEGNYLSEVGSIEYGEVLPKSKRGQRPDCLLGSAAASRLNITEEIIGLDFRVNGKPCRVLGVLAPAVDKVQEQFSDMVLTTMDAMIDRLENSPSLNNREVDEIIIVYNDLSDRAIQRRDLDVLLRKRNGISMSAPDPYKYDKRSFSIAQLQNQRNLTSILGGLLGGLAAFASLTGVYAIIFNMLSSRRVEIATQSALGARKRDLFAQLFVESAMLSILGGIVGLVLSVGLIRIIATTSDIPTSIDYLQFTMVVLISGICVMGVSLRVIITTITTPISDLVK